VTVHAKDFIIAGVVAFLSMPAFAQQEAGAACEKIDASYVAAPDPDSFSSTGEITSGLLQGATRFTGDTASLVQLSAPVFPPVEPLTFAYTGDTMITTAQGSLTVRGAGVFERVPSGRGTLLNRVIDGTGIFTGSTGFLFFNFNFGEQGMFESTVAGEICLAPAGGSS
jgi:hypothetical protein